MDGKLENLQWQKNSATGNPYNHSDRCLDKRLGTYCKRVWDFGRENGGNGQRKIIIFT